MSKNNENKLVPRLRFPEFNDNWNPKQICDLLEYERPDNYIVNDTNYTTEGTPVLTANKSFILGYTEETNGICEDIPAIIFDDFTVDKKFVDFPFKVKSSAIKILRPKGKDDLKFIFELMSLIKFEAKEHKRYYISAYQNLSIPIPKPNEQQKIAACLSSLDDVITAESKKLEVLKEHKKGLLQNLFPQQGETVPKLRFKEFEDSGEWEENVLKEVTTFVHEKTQLKTLSIDSYISTENLLSNYAGVTLASKLPSSGNFTKYQKGDILISNIRPYLKKVWFADKNGACSNDVIVIRGKSLVLDIFLSFLLRNDDFINYIMKSAEGVKMPRGDKDSIKEYLISFPKEKSEQQKIADTLSSIDDLINAQSQKIETLKLHKKGLLQGLFPDVNEHNG